MTFSDLDTARKSLGLPERATLEEIRSCHRALAKKYHPDSGNPEHVAKFRQAEEAYQTLMAYCGHYRFSFAHEEFLEQNPDERLREQFGFDPVWGGKP